MTMSSGQTTIIKRLTALLKENGTSILTDGAPLSLSIGFLHFLNCGFSQLTDEDFGTSFEALPGSSTQVPFCQELQFLYDFIQKTPKLKLFQDCAGLCEAVSITTFRSLRELELRHVPISMVTGIHKLRGRLNVLVCNYCLCRLEEILEHGETNSGSTLMWTQLTSLSCSHNSISELDNSLRLLPVVEVLDLSHNSLRDTDSYLEHLTELRSLNLGYNLLLKVPSLALSCHTKLKQLSLRQNQLENIEGVQFLTMLTDLDVAYNCLLAHRILWPLRKLPKLKMLVLEGNPLSFHKKHRIFTVEQLHPLVVKQLTLDRRKLTPQECLAVKLDSVEQQAPAPAQVTRECTSLPGSDYWEGTDDTLSATSLPETQRTSTTTGQRKKKQRKPRTVEICDVEETTHSMTSASTSEERQDSHRGVPKEHLAWLEVQTIRSQVGPDWLQTIAVCQQSANISELPHKGAKQTKIQVTEGSETVSESVKDKKTTESSAVSSESVQEKELKSGEQQSNGTTTTGKVNKESNTALHAEVDTDVDSEVNGCLNTEDSTEVNKNLNIEEATGTDKEMSADKGTNVNIEEDNKVDISEVENGTNLERNTSESVTSVTAESSNHVTDKVDSRVDQADVKECQAEKLFSWNRVDSADVDYGPESEPFIVQHADGNAEDRLLITVSRRYVLEKDIEGTVLEALDQRCLRRVELVTGGATVSESPHRLKDLILVRLYFDYYKKDKTERCYVMEDKQAAETLIELLEPAVELHEISEALQDILQCLKCNTQFSLSENKKKFPGAKDDSRKCPKCNSDMIIELDMGQISRILYNDSPQGSIKSGSVKSQSPIGSIKSASLHLESPALIRRNASGTSLSEARLRKSRDLTNINMDARSRTGSLVSPARQVSESSDIVVLDEKRQSVTSMSSDIAVLSADGAASGPVLTTIDDPPCEPTEVTPCGSLSEKTIHSMVSSIYENTFNSFQDTKTFMSANSTTDDRTGEDSNQSFHSIQDPEEKTLSEASGAVDLDLDADLIRFPHVDFSFIDHRLKLYLSLEVLGADEDLCILLQCGVVSLDDPEEFSGVLVVTNTKYYVINTELPLRADQLAKCMKLKYSGELCKIEHIEQGYNAMCWYLISNKARFNFLQRDMKRCEAFLEIFTDHLRAIPQHSDLEIKMEQITSNNVLSEVLDTTDGDVHICLYVMCHQQVAALESGAEASTPVSIIVSPDHVAMVTEDQHYILQSLADRTCQSAQHKTPSGQRQFEVKDIQKLTDVTTIELKSSNPRAVSVTFSEEGSSEMYTWLLLMETADTKEAFVAVVTKLWEEQFGVDFICKYS